MSKQMQDASESIPEAVNESLPLAPYSHSHCYKVRIYTRILTGLCALLWITCYFSYINPEIVKISALRRQTHYLPFNPKPHTQMSYTLRAFGSITVIFGVCGWWGALHQRRTSVFVFSCLLLLLSVVEMIYGAITLYYVGKTTPPRKEDLVKDLKQINDSKADEKNNLFLSVQRKQECCGVFSYRDWIASPWWESQRDINTSVVIPKSCCGKKIVSVECYTGNPPYKDVISPNLIHKTGCMDKISLNQKYMDSLYRVTGAFAIFSGLLKFAGFFLILYFANIIHAHKSQTTGDTSEGSL